MTMRIGFIGLGIMGRPMALNLLAAGYPLTVYSPRKESAQTLIEKGAALGTSPADVARLSDVTIVMVRETADVEEVLTGNHGVVDGAARGTVVVDMSTISPSVTRRLAKTLAGKGVDMLDAPVSGGEQGAIEGNLSIMVGGKEAVFERVRPLFEILGSRAVHIGDHGAGQVAKACNQILVAETIAAVGEALLLARAGGADPERVREALLGGFAGSRVLEVHGKRMLDRDFTPGFKAQLHQKDLRIALEMAQEERLALPTAALVAQWLNALVDGDGDNLDSSALVTVQERLAGLELGPG